MPDAMLSRLIRDKPCRQDSQAAKACCSLYKMVPGKGAWLGWVPCFRGTQLLGRQGKFGISRESMAPGARIGEVSLTTTAKARSPTGPAYSGHQPNPRVQADKSGSCDGGVPLQTRSATGRPISHPTTKTACPHRTAGMQTR